MQQLIVTIPPSHVLITKVEYEDLKRELTGVYWTMQDLEKHTGRGHIWIKDNILLPQKFRNKLDVEYGGCVSYPKSQGQTWTFHATKMVKFLDTHFEQIFKADKVKAEKNMSKT